MTATGGRLDVQPPPDQPAPQPPPRINQNFVPNKRRPPEEWNDAHRPLQAFKSNPDVAYSSTMPGPGEEIGVMKGSANALALWGSPQVASIGRTMANLLGYPLDFYSQGAFGRAYDSGTAARIAMHREEAALARDRAIDLSHDMYMATRAHLEPYKEIFSELKNNAFSKDEAKNTEGAKRAIIALANSETGGVDRPLLAALENGGPLAAEKLLMDREARALDNYSAAVALGNTKTARGKTVKEESEDDKALSTDAPRAGGKAVGGWPDLTHADETTKEDELSDAGSMEDIDKAIANKHHLTERGMQDARDHFEHPQTNPQIEAYEKSHPTNTQYVTAATNDLRNIADRAVRGPGTTDEKLEKLRNISPFIAGGTEGLLSNEQDPKNKDNIQFRKWAQAVSNNKWKDTNYDLKRRMELPESSASKTMYRVHQAATGLEQIIEASREFSPEDKITKQMIEK